MVAGLRRVPNVRFYSLGCLAVSRIGGQIRGAAMNRYRAYHRYLLRRLRFVATLMLYASPLGMLASMFDMFSNLGWNLGCPGVLVFATIFILAAVVFKIVAMVQRNVISDQ